MDTRATVTLEGISNLCCPRTKLPFLTNQDREVTLHLKTVRILFTLFDKTVKSHGFFAKGLWKEGKISAIKFLAFSCKETT